MSTETTREPKEQARNLFHGEHILDRMKAGSHFWDSRGASHRMPHFGLGWCFCSFQRRC